MTKADLERILDKAIALIESGERICAPSIITRLDTVVKQARTPFIAPLVAEILSIDPNVVISTLGAIEEALDTTKAFFSDGSSQRYIKLLKGVRSNQIVLMTIAAIL